VLTRGESSYDAYAICHPVFLELVKDPAMLLIWSGLRPSTAHQFYLIYIPEPTLHFCVRNQWEKDPCQAPHIARKKQESPKKCNGYNTFCRYIFCMLANEITFLVVSLCKRIRDKILYFQKFVVYVLFLIIFKNIKANKNCIFGYLKIFSSVALNT